MRSVRLAASPLTLALLVTAGLSAGCSSRSAESRPQSPATAVAASESGLEERALLLQLADRKLYEPEALGVMLDGPPDLREQLAVALGRIGDPRGRSMLQGLLVDADPAVRRAAAFALGELGSADAIRALRAAAVDDDAETGALAVEALGKVGAPLPDVRRILGALAPEEANRRLAPYLFRFDDPSAVEAAVELLASPEGAERRGAAYALGRQAHPEALATLRSLIADPDPFVRAWAGRGLGIVGGAEDLAALLGPAREDETSPRIQAIAAAAKIARRVDVLAPEGWEAALARAMADPLPGVRATALAAAGAFLPQAALESALVERFGSGPVRERELALASLVEGDPSAALELAGRAATAPEPALRASAAEAAGALGDRELLGRLAADEVAAVRRAEVEASLALAGEDDVAVVRRGLADADPTVRATVLDHLAKRPSLDLRELADALRGARGDAEPDARLAAIRAIAARGEASAAERGPAVATLEAVARDADYLVRREAREGLRALGFEAPPATPIDTGRPNQTYREALRQAAARPLFEVESERGTFRIRLECPDAPLTCLSFWKLAEQGYFDGLVFHRVVPDFVVQSGDPRGDGWGGPGYSLRDEINRLRYVRGAVGMALSGPDTGGSQFFVTLSPQPHLDGGYTVFGTVVAGLEVLDRIEQGDRIRHVRRVD